MLSPHDPHVAAFIERLDAALRRLPPQERADLHAELREHLNALIAAHLELGASPTEAADAALRQFGAPDKIGAKLYREWRVAHARPSLAISPRGLLTLLWIGGLVHVLFSIPVDALDRDWTVLALLPLLLGLLGGATIARKPVASTVLAAAAALLVTFGTFAAGLLSWGAPTRNFSWDLAGSDDAVVLLTACWLSAGTAGAFAASLLRRAVRRRGPGITARA